MLGRKNSQGSHWLPGDFPPTCQTFFKNIVEWRLFYDGGGMSGCLPLIRQNLVSVVSLELFLYIKKTRKQNWWDVSVGCRKSEHLVFELAGDTGQKRP
jgi:hypothetical protein